MSPQRYVPILACLILAGCGDDIVGPVDQEGPPVQIDPSDVDLYEGSIGLVLDVRPIFRKGYLPTQAELAFPDHPAFDTTLEIDPLTNVAILIIQNDSLTENQRTAFEREIAADIAIVDSSGTVLASLSGEPVRLDDSNLPFLIKNDTLPPIPPPFVLTQGVPYLLIPDGFDGLLTVGEPGPLDLVVRAFTTEPFVQDTVVQAFHFSIIGDDTYSVRNLATPSESAGCVRAPLFARARLVFDGRFDDDSACENSIARAELVAESEPGGWVRLRRAGTNLYAVYEPPGLLLDGRVFLDASRGTATRFRFVSGALAWDITDRGTSFNQPVIPPERLDFAFQATLTNCSAATLTETIGTELTRTRRTTFATSESLQIFAGFEIGSTLTVGASTTVPVPPLLVDVSAEVSTSWKLSTSLTFQTGNTFEETEEVQNRVSRSRELVVPPFSALVATDIVRTVENVVTPFTQTLRIRARNRETLRSLSGPEIRTQIESGFFDGVVTRVGGDFIEVTVRGEVLTDQFIQAQTTVFEVPGACG